jgi:hypothetical protein
MSVEQEITIKVSPDIARAYLNATDAEREQVQLKMMSLLELQLGTSRKEAVAKLRKTMDALSLEATERGLTPEILASILNECE